MALPVAELDAVFPVAVIYRRETYRPPALLRFVDVLKAETRALSGQ